MKWPDDSTLEKWMVRALFAGGSLSCRTNHIYGICSLTLIAAINLNHRN